MEVKQAYKEYNEAKEYPHFSNLPYKFIKCKACESQLARAYLGRRNCCPVCNYDLRPASAISQIERLHNKADRLLRDMQIEEMRLTKKYGKVMWLIHIEYQD